MCVALMTWSIVENTEIGMVIESTDIAVGMSEWFDQIAFRLALEKDNNCDEILVWYRSVDGSDQRFTREPNTGFWRRFGVGVLRLLPIEWLL